VIADMNLDAGQLRNPAGNGNPRPCGGQPFYRMRVLLCNAEDGFEVIGIGSFKTRKVPALTGNGMVLGKRLIERTEKFEQHPAKKDTMRFVNGATLRSSLGKMK